MLKSIYSLIIIPLCVFLTASVLYTSEVLYNKVTSKYYSKIIEEGGKEYNTTCMVENIWKITANKDGSLNFHYIDCEDLKEYTIKFEQKKEKPFDA